MPKPNKSSKLSNKRISVRLPVMVHEEMEKLSLLYGVPLSNLVSYIVAQWVLSQKSLDDKVYGRLVDVLRDELKDVVKDELIKEVKSQV